MLLASEQISNSEAVVALEPERSFPWPYVEAALAVILAVAVFTLPIATLTASGFQRSVTVWQAANFMMDMASINQGSFGIVVLTVLFAALLGLGVASVADTAFCSVEQVTRGKKICASWGMVAFGLGMMALCELSGHYVDGGTLGFESLQVGLSVWVSLVGGMVCGLIDVIRSRCA